ncbi:alpha/beta fold hydrolase [Legionella sp. W05-934-2]|uniref:alpha/beta fold hydrolase n=1 Tax=Legionella sp. W05-934-2 TaxID=1198649 RepID=UPI003462DF7A
MVVLIVNGCYYYYDIQGDGEETILFSHGLLWSGKVFQAQVEHLKKKYRVITYDHRGQGRSEVTEAGYDMDSLCDDTIQLIERLGFGKVHFVGLSMGGFIGLRVAARRPDLIQSLILMGTSAQAEPYSLKYKVLILLLKLFGMKSVSRKVMKIYFADNFRNDNARRDQYEFWKREIEANPKTVIKAVDGVLNRKGVESELANIRCPTLIMVGDNDMVTPPERAKLIHQHIDHSILKYIPNAGHTPGIEEPALCNQYIDEFLASQHAH